MKNEELEKIMSVAQSWIDGDYDEQTKQQVKAMMEAEDETPLIDSFYRTLEFGTGGLRGIMGPGTNRMNQYITVVIPTLLTMASSGPYSSVNLLRVAIDSSMLRVSI